MASFEDSLGRSFEAANGFNDIKDLLKSLLQGKVGPATKYNPKGDKPKEEDKSKAASKVVDLLKEISETITDELKSSKDYFAKIIKAHKDAEKSKESKKQDQTPTVSSVVDAFGKALSKVKHPEIDATTKILETIGKNISDLVKHATHAGSIYVHDIHVVDAVNKAAKDMASGGGGGKVTLDNIEGNPIGEFAKSAQEIAVHMKASEKSAKATAGFMATTMTAFLGGATLWQITMGGVVEDELKFMQNMRRTAFMLEGVTGETKTLQKQWEEIGTTVDRTGMSRSTFQDQLNKSMRNGIRIHKDAMEVTATNLNLSTMIDSNVETTNDTFAEIYRITQSTTNEMSDLSRGVQDVARFTGVTGDNLMAAVNASKQFLKQMRNAGTYTSAAAANMIGLQASAQKFGIDDTMQSVMEGLGGQSKLFKLDPQTQTMLFKVANLSGTTDKLMTGEIPRSKESMKQFATGFDKLIEQVTGGLSIKDVELMAQVDPEGARRINMALESAFGREIGQIKFMRESFIENAKSFGERISDIDAAMKNSNLTQEEKIKLQEQERQLYSNLGMSFLSQFDKFAKEGGSIEEAVNRALATNPDFATDLQSAGIDTSDQTNMLSAVAKMTADKLEEAGSKKDFSSKLEDAIANQDVSGIRSIIGEMTAELETIGANKVQQLDPITSLEKTIKELNDTIREHLGGMLISILDFVGPTGILAGILATVALQGILLSKLLRKLLHKVVGGAAISMMAGGGIKGMLEGAFKGVGGIFKSVATGAKAAIQSVPKLFSAITTGFGAMKGPVLTGFGLIFDTMKSGVKGVLSKVPNVFGAMSAGFNAMKGPVATGIGILGRGLLPALRGIGAVVSKLALPVTIAVGAISGLIGGFKAASNAAEIFGVKQEEVTFAQKASAGVAGTLTGILNFLTFGVFSDLFGVTGSVTKALSKFIHTFSPLGLIFQGIGAVFSGIYNLVSSAMSGIWEAVQIVVQPFVDAFNEIQAAVSDVVKPVIEAFNGLFGIFGDGNTDALSGITDALSFVGIVLGEVAKTLGMIVGFMIKIVLKPIVWAAKMLITALSPVMSAISYIIEGIGGFLKLVWGLFTFNLDSISNGIDQIFSSLGNLLMLPFRVIGQIGSWLWNGFTNALATLPGWLLDGMINALTALPQFLWNVITGAFSVIWDVQTWIWNAVIGGLSVIWNIGTWLWDSITGAVANFGGWLWDMITAPFKTIGEWILGLMPDWLKSGAKGFSETAEEQAATRAKEGDSIIHGASGFFGGLFDLDFAKMWEGAKETVSSLNPFADGTREITQGGIALLHKGEKVIPSTVADAMGDPYDSPVEKAGANLNLMSDELLNSGNTSLISSSLRGTVAEAGLSTTANAKPLTDAYDRVREQYALRDAEVNTGSTKEMSRVAAAADEQVRLLMLVHEDLGQVIDLLKPTTIRGGAGSKANTKTKRNSPTVSSDYGQWQFGQFNRNPSTQVISNGI